MRLARLALPAAAGLILTATLYPAYGARIESSPWCLTCDGTWLADLLGNVALFLPFGAALALSGRSVARALLLGALLSIGVELAQVMVPGRTSTLRDVLSNACGSGLGAFLFHSAPQWLLPAHARRASWGAAALLLALTTVLLGGWLARPAAPNEPLRAEWRPDAPFRTGPYPGALLAASVGGVALADGEELPRAAMVHVQPGGDRISLRVRWKGVPRGRRSLFALTDSTGAEQEAVEITGKTAIEVVRSRGSVIGLRPRETWIHGIVDPEPSADVLQLTIMRRLGRICGVANGRGACTPAAAVGRGWTLIQSQSPVPRPWLPLVDGIWLAALFLPAGLWLRGLLLPAGGALMLSLIGLPPLAGMVTATAWEITAAVAGLALGSALQPALMCFATRSSVPRSPAASPWRLWARTRRHSSMRR